MSRTISTRTMWDQIGAAGRRTFMAMPDGNLDYPALGVAIRRWLAWFDSAGIAAGDRFVLRTGNDTVAATGFIAALLDGVVPVLLAGDTPDLRVAALAAKVEAKAFVDSIDAQPNDLAPGIGRVPLGNAQPASRGWFGRRAAPDPLHGLPDPTARAPRLPEDTDGLAYILFTSGTTAAPSGVQITRGNLFANVATMSRLFGYIASDRIFNDMVLAHTDGMTQGPVMALANGCTVIRAGGFQVGTMEQWLDRVRRERATHVITVPTIWAMIDAYAAHDDYFDAPECRALMSVAAKLPDDLWTRIEARFRRPLFNQYGLTETVASALYAGPWPEMGSHGTVGLPVDCEARIDPDSPDPREGELHLRGDNVFPGYWRDEERTARTFTPDGWMRTGDLARMRDDGSYEIAGRLKAVIMMGGFLIRPDEIDEAMQRHPAIRESVTVGVEDAMFGEVPVTAVVLHPGAGPLDDAVLAEHARTFLEARKVPKRIVVLDAIPRGDSGKARLADLRAMLAAPDAATQAGGAAAGEASDLAAAVLALAADVFRVDPAQLTRESRAGAIPGWDSFSQLNFVMAAEDRFGIRIPAAHVARIATIADMVEAVKSLRP